MKILLTLSMLLFFILACGSSKELSAVEVAILKSGEEVFQKYCMACHGKDGKLSLNGAQDLTKYIGTKKRIIKVVQEGKGLMTPFKNILTKEEIEAVAKYTIQLRKNKKK